MIEKILNEIEECLPSGLHLVTNEKIADGQFEDTFKVALKCKTSVCYRDLIQALEDAKFELSEENFNVTFFVPTRLYSEYIEIFVNVTRGDSKWFYIDEDEALIETFEDYHKKEL